MIAVPKKTKKRKKKSSRITLADARRLLIIVCWCAVVAVLLALALRFWLGGKARERRLARAANAREALEQVVIPASVQDTIVRYHGFTVHFNSRLHVPNCVVYELTASEATATAAARMGSFEADTTVRGCAQPWDYTGTGYDRGHMAPAGDFRWSEAAMHDTFYMTNVCPQPARLNAGAWGALEEKTREWAERDSALIVISGPVITGADQRIGKGRIAVPHSFFKVLLAPHASPARAIGFVIDAKSSPKRLRQRAVTVDEVERATGIDFFAALPSDVERDVESRLSLDAWWDK